MLSHSMDLLFGLTFVIHLLLAVVSRSDASSSNVMTTETSQQSVNPQIEEIENTMISSLDDESALTGEGEAIGKSGTSKKKITLYKGLDLSTSDKKVIVSVTENVTLTCRAIPILIREMPVYKLLRLEMHKVDPNTASSAVIARVERNSVPVINDIENSEEMLTKGRIHKKLPDSYLTILWPVAVDETPGSYFCKGIFYTDKSETTTTPVFAVAPVIIDTEDIDLIAIIRLLRKQKMQVIENRDRLQELLERKQKLMEYFSRLKDKETLYRHHWPSGNFALVEPSTGCPPIFHQSWSVSKMIIPRYRLTSKKDTIPKHFKKSALGSSDIETSFCQIDGRGFWDWPAGDYCINKHISESPCPKGFQEGSIRLSIKKSRSGSPGDELDKQPSSKSVSFCCRNDGNANEEITLPTQFPFYMYQYKKASCQRVKDMKAEVDDIHYQVSHNGKDKATGEVPRHTLNGVHLWLCYYSYTGPTTDAEEPPATTHQKPQKFKHHSKPKHPSQSDSKRPMMRAAFLEHMPEIPVENYNKTSNLLNIDTASFQNKEAEHPQNKEAEHPQNTGAENTQNTETKSPHNTVAEQTQNKEAEHTLNKEAEHTLNKEAEHPQSKEAEHTQNKEAEHTLNKEAEHPQSKEAEHTQNKEAEHTQNKEAEHTQNKEAEHTQNKEAEHTQNKEAEHTVNKEAEHTPNTGTELLQNTRTEHTQTTDAENTQYTRAEHTQNTNTQTLKVSMTSESRDTNALNLHQTQPPIINN
ncbi:uncharacterized protein LOC131951633 [Physella acuta]|uniref:uncharacterized protein LOC131951633 n=1 Tax=Physella acuta TaxID=109671 RepID=UPI0027DD114A|nr:uncharacterized protein LOC131951633 [Physella acuta]